MRVLAFITAIGKLQYLFKHEIILYNTKRITFHKAMS